MASWSLAKITGSAKWPDVVPDGFCPVPLADLTTAADAGTSATYAVTADGQATGAVLTMAVQSAIEAAPVLTVATKADIVTRLAGIKATLGGKIVAFQVGCEAAFANINDSGSTGAGDIAYFSAFNTHSGTFTLRNADPARPARLGRLWLSNCARISLEGLDCRRTLTPWPANGRTALQQATAQARACLRIQSCADITVFDLVAGEHTGSTDPTTWPNGIDVTGDSTSPSERVTLDGVTLRRTRNGLSFGDCSFLTYRNVDHEWGCGDFINGGGGGYNDVLIELFWLRAPVDNPATPGTHPDCNQHGSVNCERNLVRVLIRLGILEVAMGLSSAQGTYFNDTGFHGSGTGPKLQGANQYMTGFQCEDCRIEHVLYLGGHLRGITMDYGTDWGVSHCMTLRSPALASPEAEIMSDPLILPLVASLEGTGTPIISAGTIRGCVAHLPIESAPGITLVDNYSIGASPGGGLANYEALMTYYEQFFENPRHPDPRVGFRSKAGGPLDLGGGRFMGVWAPGGAPASSI